MPLNLDDLVKKGAANRAAEDPNNPIPKPISNAPPTNSLSQLDSFINESRANNQPPEPEKKGRTVLGTVGDAGIATAKGVLDLGSGLMGLSNMASGGNLSGVIEKPAAALDSAGEWLEDRYSEPQKLANKNVADAEGFTGTAKEMFKNPSTIPLSLLETFGPMGGGAAITKGLVKGASKFAGKEGLKTGTKMGLLGAGEGSIQAGSMAEDLRKDDGELTGKEIAMSAGSGVTTGLFTSISAGLANKFGFLDAESLLAGLSRNTGKKALTPKKIAQSIASAGFTEAALEELPQSVTETMWMNAATGRPIMEGAAEAAAKGMVIGAFMGGSLNASQIAKQAVLSDRYGKSKEMTDELEADLGNDDPLGQEVNNLVSESFEDLETADLNRSPESLEAEQLGYDLSSTNVESEEDRTNRIDLLNQFMDNPDVSQEAKDSIAETGIHKFLGLEKPVTEASETDAEAARLYRYNQLKTINEGVPALKTTVNGEEFDVPEVKSRVFTPEEKAEYDTLSKEFTENNATQAPKEEPVYPEWEAQKKASELYRKKSNLKEEEDIGYYPEVPLSKKEQAAKDEAEALSTPQGRLDAINAKAKDYVLTPREEVERSDLQKEIKAGDKAKVADPKAPALRQYESVKNELKVLQEKGKDNVLSKREEIKIEELQAEIAAGPKFSREMNEITETNLDNERSAGDQRVQPGAQENGDNAPRSEPKLVGVDTAAVERIKNARADSGLRVKRNLPTGNDGKTIAVSNKDSIVYGGAVEVNPTEAQKKAENYKTQKVNVDGLNLSIENPAGSERSGKAEDGKTWSQKMNSDYGRILGSVGFDKDHVDIMVNPGYKGGGTHAYIVNQVNQDGKFDEHKVVLGVGSESEALASYNANYEKGWTGGKSVTKISIPALRKWAKGSGPSKGEFVRSRTVAANKLLTANNQALDNTAATDEAATTQEAFPDQKQLFAREPKTVKDDSGAEHNVEQLVTSSFVAGEPLKNFIKKIRKVVGKAYKSIQRAVRRFHKAMNAHLDSVTSGAQAGNINVSGVTVDEAASLPSKPYSLIVGTKPGEFGWTAAENFEGPIRNDQRKVDDKGIYSEAPPIIHPVNGKPRPAKIAKAVSKFLSTKKTRAFLADAIGVKDFKLIQSSGSWLGNPEPSFYLDSDTMSFSQADSLSRLLGFAFAQDGVVVAEASEDSKIGALSIRIGGNKKLTPDNIQAILELSNTHGIDFTTTRDGKGVSYVYFGEESGQEAFIKSVAQIKNGAGFTQSKTYLTKSELNEYEEYDQETAGKIIREIRNGSSTEGGSDLFRGTADNLIIPYAKAVAGEGYRFSPERFGKRFGLNKDQVAYLEDALRPKTGWSRSIANILRGTEKLDGLEGTTLANGKLKPSVSQVLWALQNRSGKTGLVAPGDYSNQARKVMAQAITDEVVYHIEEGGGKSAIGWYDDALKRAKKIYYQSFPEIEANSDAELLFDLVLGITSQGSDVHTNSKNTLRLYSMYRKSGTLSDGIEKYKTNFGKETSAIAKNLTKLQSLIDTHGIVNIEKFLNRTKTVGQWNALIRKDKFFAGQRGLKISGASTQKVAGWMVFGPKIGSFINNLRGNFDTLTADLWFTRTWNRIQGFAFTHVPMREAKQYQSFKEALLAEWNFSPKPGKGGKPTNPGTELLGMTAKQFDELLGDPDAMLAKAEEIEYAFRKSQYKGGTNLRRAAKVWVEGRNAPGALPRGDVERAFQQATMEQAQKMVKRKIGSDISIADMQAALWFSEKELFNFLGNSSKTSVPADYADAAKEAVKAYGKAKPKFSREKSENKTLTPESAETRGASVNDSGVHVFPNGDVGLIHWSNAKNIEEIDPSYSGTGISGNERKRRDSDPDNWVNRTYHGIEGGGYRQEPGLGVNTYRSSVPFESIYDMRKDPDGFSKKAAAAKKKNPFTNMLNVIEKSIKEAGYAGYWTESSLGQVAAMFDTVDVQPVNIDEIVTNPASASDDSMGRKYREFFSNVTKGAKDKYKPDLSKYKPVMKMNPSVQEFQNERYRFRGTFDQHIMTSIPSFDEIQAVVGQAIVDSYPDGATVIDIGASEGSTLKAISSRSNGMITGVAVDPNQDMRDTFVNKGLVPGVEHSMTAFVGSESYGDVMWDEPANDGSGTDVKIKGYDPKGQKFDIVHESMAFQFIGSDRQNHIDAASEVLADDGIMILEEKYAQPDKQVQEDNEEFKDAWKLNFYTKEQLSKKEKDVLRRKIAEGDEAAVGMQDDQVVTDDFEAMLLDRFKHVYQYWDSGNFRGYAASNSKKKIETFVGNLQTNDHQFQTKQVPVEVTYPGVNKPQEVLTDNVKFSRIPKSKQPVKSVKAYKLFKVKKNKPGELFPLFVNANDPVLKGEWVKAEIGPQNDNGKVKSKLGPLAFRPGWHSGDTPTATHIGEGGTPPKYRPADHVWAEVEVADDVDWQTEANSRAKAKKGGGIIANTAHITDRLPDGGHYRYKTNPNMTGSWLISGEMRINRILSDDEVQELGNDLPRRDGATFDKEAWGFTETDFVKPVKKSTGENSGPKDNVTSVVIKQFGEDGFNALVNSGTLNIITPSQLPGVLGEHYDPAYTDKGFVIGDKVYLVDGHINEGETMDIMMHELGSHDYLDNLLQSNMSDMVDMLESGEKQNTPQGKAIRAAKERIPANTPAKDYNSEWLAYYVQDGKRADKLYRRVLAYVKDAMLRLWFSPKTVRLSPEDLRTIAEIAVRRRTRNTVLYGYGGTRTISADTPKEFKFSREDVFKSVDTKSHAFKKWFSGSKVVDEDNAPLVVYHTSKEKINIFDDNFKTDLSSMGFHFGTKEQAKFRSGQYDFSGGDVTLMPVFLSIKNPLEVSHMASFAPDHLAEIMIDNGLIDEERYDDIMDEFIDETDIGGELASILKSEGYDGLVYKNEREGEGNSYVAFSPTQIKSATSNTGEFSTTNPDIRFSRDVQPVTGDMVNSSSFKKWFGKSKIQKNGNPVAVYHGSSSFGLGGKESWSFDTDEESTSTGSPLAGLGNFFALSESDAAGYSRGTGNVQKLAVKAENPLVINSWEIPTFSEPAEAKAFGKRKQLQGYDSIYIKDEKHIVTFDSAQTKSLKKNTGDFDGNNPDVRFSREENFKKWFSGSTVVDGNGDPQAVYHGTTTGGFTEFNPNNISDLTMMSAQGPGFYFTDKKNASQYTKANRDAGRRVKKSQLYEVFLSIKNPLKITGRSKNIPLSGLKSVYTNGDKPWFFSNWIPFELDGRNINGVTRSKDDISELSKEEKVNLYVEEMSGRGDAELLSNIGRAYKDKALMMETMSDKLNADGVEFSDSHGKIHVAWSPTQIKSATSNTGEFSTTNPDIRFSRNDNLKDIEVMRGTDSLDEGMVTHGQKIIAEIYRKLASVSSPSVVKARFGIESIEKTIEKYQLAVKTVYDPLKGAAEKQKFAAGFFQKLPAVPRAQLLQQLSSISRVKSAKAQQKRLESLLRKGNNSLSGHLRKEILTKIEAAVNPTKRQKNSGGKHKVGRGADFERDLGYIRDALKVGEDIGVEKGLMVEWAKLDAEHTDLLGKYNNSKSEGEANDVQVKIDDLESRGNLLSIFGGLSAQSLDELVRGTKAMAVFLENGRMPWRIHQELARERQKANVAQASKDITGSENPEVETPAQATQREKKEKSVKGITGEALSAAGNMINSWELILDKITKGQGTLKSWTVKHFSGLAHQATRDYERMMLDSNKLVMEKAVEVFGVKDTKQLAKVLAKLDQEVDGKVFTYKAGVKSPLNISPMQAAYWKAISKGMDNPNISGTFGEMGVTDQTFKEIERLIGPDLSKWVDYIVDEFLQDFHGDINKVHQVVYGVDLDKTENYIPLHRKVYGTAADKQKDGHLAANLPGSIVKGGLKTRVNNTKQFKVMNLNQVLVSHIADMSHFKAWAIPTKEINSTFNSPTIQSHIRANHGASSAKSVRRFQDRFVKSDMEAIDDLKFLDSIRGNITKAMIGMNPVVFLKQLTSLPAYMADIPAADWYKYTAEAFANPAKASRILSKSTMMEYRYLKGHDRDIATSMKKGGTNMITQRKKIGDHAMILTQLGDRFAITMGGYAVYKHHLEKRKAAGMKHAKAHKEALTQFEMATERAQQSANTKDMGWFQGGNSVMKLFTMFMTSPASYSRQIFTAVRNAKLDPKDSAKRLFIYAVVLPMVFSAVADALLIVDGDDDDKEKFLKDQAHALAVAPFNGLPVIRTMMEGYFQAINGDNYSDQFSPAVQGYTTSKRTVQDFVKYLDDGTNMIGPDEYLERAFIGLLHTLGYATGIPTKPVGKIATGVYDAVIGNTEHPIRRSLGYSKFVVSE